MNNVVLQSVTEHKHLGLILTENGSWDKHIDLVISKSFKRLNVLRNFKFKLNRTCLEHIYFTFIRPVVEYADIVWDNKTVSLVNKIEAIQIEAARIVTGGTRLTSIENLYRETGWEKLAVRRQNHKIVQMYKIINNYTPLYLRNLLPDRSHEIHTYYTRNPDRLYTILTRTSLYSSYFFPSAVQLWNTLPDTIKNKPSVESLKSYFASRKIKKPIYYNLGTRLGQILHARLRMAASSLNEHLFLKNIIANPYCSCGITESSTHYLLKCTKYTELRRQYIFSLNFPFPKTIDILLFGSDNLSVDENTIIFSNVQKFLINSKRFVQNR